MLKSLNDKLAIVVASCRKYDDAWGPFIDLFRIYWKHCSYRTVLVADDIVLDEAYNLARICGGYDDIIPVGQDKGWIPNLLAGILKLENSISNILLMQEDFFLSGPVNTQIIEEANWIVAQDPAIVCARLMPCPGADIPIMGIKNFGLLNKEQPYLVSCQAAIWKKNALASLLLSLAPRTTAFDFEISGTKSKPNGEFISVFRHNPFPLPYLVSAISRGKWNPDAIKLCKANNVLIDVSKRPIDGVQV